MADPTSRPPPSETPISPAVATQTPSINTSVPAINAQPVELDGIPTSPREQQLKHREVGESRLLSLVDDGDLGVESLSASGKSAGPLGREKRDAILASRSNDPSVIVDIPAEPTAEAVEAADSKDRRVVEAST